MRRPPKRGRLGRTALIHNSPTPCFQSVLPHGLMRCDNQVFGTAVIGSTTDENAAGADPEPLPVYPRKVLRAVTICAIFRPRAVWQKLPHRRLCLPQSSLEERAPEHGQDRFALPVCNHDWEALMGLNIGIVGATGVVGDAMRRILAERLFPTDTIRLFALPALQASDYLGAGARLPWRMRRWLTRPGSTSCCSPQVPPSPENWLIGSQEPGPL